MAVFSGWTALEVPTAAPDYAPAPSVATAAAFSAQVALGKVLFFDPILSINGKRSCGSCHRPEKAFTDHRITARALRMTQNLATNTPTVLNSAPQKAFFHDGRAASLGAVTAAVLTHPQEFNSSYDTLVARLQTSPAYRARFAEAFGRPVITPDNVNQALTAYVTSLTAMASAFDLAERGGAALPLAARSGQALFMGAAGCNNCHAGPYFRDGRRHEIAPGVFRQTPTLRNVAVTPPYRADGQAPTLAAALTDEFHRAQQQRPLNPADVEALTAFLETLTDTASADHTRPPELPPVPHWPDRYIGGQY